MKAAILAVGSELLGPQRLDSNSLRLTTTLERFGVELIGKSAVGDDEAAIAGELRHWMRGADLVLVTGG
ncbi:MAG: competence/damage-inducible protein A, partial [Thermoanaerobaculia bacterium]|nr:competence/damage-inducible protein A [Thermoanaerobaculia bacterium]